MTAWRKERKRRRRGGGGEGRRGGWAGVGEVGGVGVQEKHKAWVNTARSASGTN